MPAQPPGPTEAAQAECRVYQRRASGLATSCRPAVSLVHGDAAWPATIRDVSPAGVRLLLRRRFEPGTGLAITMPAKGQDAPSIALARVIHVESEQTGSWSIGCKFVSELSDEELARLIPGSVPGMAPPGEQTLVDTSPGGTLKQAPMPNVHLQIEGTKGPKIYRVKNFYLPGPWPPSPGRRFALRGRRPNARVPALVLEVLSSSLNDGHWTLCCRLLKPPQ